MSDSYTGEGPFLPETDNFFKNQVIVENDYNPNFFEGFGNFFAGLGQNIDDTGAWLNDLFDPKWSKLDVSIDTEEFREGIETLTPIIDLWREFEDRKSPFFHLTNSIKNLFGGFGNWLKGIGEPSILETAKIVAFIYALTYAYSNIKSPPKRTYNYKSTGRFNYRGRGKGFTYG